MLFWCLNHEALLCIKVDNVSIIGSGKESGSEFSGKGQHFEGRMDAAFRRFACVLGAKLQELLAESSDS
jgi:hypothetical protein